MKHFKIIWPGEDKADSLGGKAEGLRRLLKAGLPVPEFFVVKPLVSDFKMLTDGSHGLEIRDICLALRCLGSPPWAIRSSAVGEDDIRASFAGIFLSKLNIATSDGVVEGIYDCLRALDSEVVRAYCVARKLPLPELMCVIVQRFLNPTAAGIAFTRHPTIPDRKVIWIEANYGVGTTVVDGSVTPDHWIISWETEQVVSSSLGTKKLRDVANDGEVHRVPNDKGARMRMCLEPHAVLQIAQLVRCAEQEVGRPVDVEWVWDGSKVTLVQARPLTVL